MQHIQRTACPDRQLSPAAYLAAMIDQRTRDRDRSATASGRLETDFQHRDASVLIWVEGEGEPAPAADGGHRGMIIVAHGCDQGTTRRSFIISYPVADDDHAQHVPAVSGVLEGMGWSVVESRGGMTDGGRLNTAALVSTAQSGAPQLLWLAEPVGVAPGPWVDSDPAG